MKENTSELNVLNSQGVSTTIIRSFIVLFTAQNRNFFIKDFFNKYDQIRSFLRIWSHLLKKSLLENFIFCAVVLLAICDTSYCFTLFDTEQYGSNNDSGVLLNLKLGKDFDENKLGIPEVLNLASCNFKPLPYYLLWDDIFSLKSWLIRSFPNQTWTKCKKFTIIANPVDVVSLKTPLEYFLLGSIYCQL